MKHLLTAIACFFALSMSAQTWNPDADFDNVIGVNDLMELLTVFGTEWTAEYPQNPDYELAAYYEGEINLIGCVQACQSNNARVINFTDYAIFSDSIEVSMEYNELTVCEGYCNYCYNYDLPVVAFLSIDSDFGYGVITRGDYGLTCNNQLPNSPSAFTETRLYSFTYSGHGYGDAGESRHCFCAGLVPVVE